METECYNEQLKGSDVYFFNGIPCQCVLYNTVNS